MTDKTTVLCVAAHPDDEVLGCGGTLAQHVDEGDNVHVLFMADGVSSRPGASDEDIDRRVKEAIAACKVLGIPEENIHWSSPGAMLPDNQLDTIPLLTLAKIIGERIDIIKPDTVYTHWPRCLNQDHRAVGQATTIACRPMSGVGILLYFEIPGSSEWSPDGAFKPGVILEIELERKLRALACYKSELMHAPHPRSQTVVSALALWRGSHAMVTAGEGFEVGRVSA